MAIYADVTEGDRITFFCNRLNETKTRTVRAVVSTGVKILHGQEVIVLPFSEIKSLSKVKARGVDGRTKISMEMYRKGITNIACSERSGYSVRTVSDVRVGKRVLPTSLKDITDTVKNWK